MCSRKNSIDTSSWKTTSLDAYSAEQMKKKIQSIINSDSSNQTMVELDQVKITQFNSFTDTLKGKYGRLKKMKLQTK
jgi:polyribonucleotide nucleotidyltransferase